MKETGMLFSAPMVRAILEGRKTQTRRVMKNQRLDKTPFGHPGDRIYARETWCQQADKFGRLIPGCYWYRATTPDVVHADSMEKSPWRPSIHMTKAEARIWLEVTGVRVQRLQDISYTDCIAEGVNRITHGMEGDYFSAVRNEPHINNWIFADYAFRELWESTGGDWDANPWVWVVDFKVLSTTGRP